MIRNNEMRKTNNRKVRSNQVRERQFLCKCGITALIALEVEIVITVMGKVSNLILTTETRRIVPYVEKEDAPCVEEGAANTKWNTGNN